MVKDISERLGVVLEGLGTGGYATGRWAKIDHGLVARGKGGV